jgi:hypothetical protein
MKLQYNKSISKEVLEMYVIEGHLHKRYNMGDADQCQQ